MTQCYLPSDTSEHTPSIQEAGTWFTYRSDGRM